MATQLAVLVLLLNPGSLSYNSLAHFQMIFSQINVSGPTFISKRLELETLRCFSKLDLAVLEGKAAFEPDLSVRCLSAVLSFHIDAPKDPQMPRHCHHSPG